MNIRFMQIEAHNFMSFADISLHLDNNGSVLVQGLNNCISDNATSNGSGKTAIWEAISWGLTGQTVRGSKAIVNNKSDDGCYVKLDFTLDDNHYRVIRAKDSKEYGASALELYVNDKNVSGKGIRDTEKILAEYLPELTPPLIGSVIILSQGLPQRFSNNSPSGRKEILEKLTKSDFMIEDIKSRITTRKSQLEKERHDFELALTADNARKELLESRINKFQFELSSMSSIEALEADLTMIEDEVARLTQQKEDNEDFLQVTRESYEKALLQDKDVSTNKQAEANRIRKDYDASIAPLKETQYKIDAELTSACNEKKRIDSIRDVCPTCGQKLIGVEKPSTDKIEEQIRTLTAQKNSVREEFDNLLSEQEKKLKAVDAEFEIELSTIAEEIRRCKLSIQSRESAQNDIDMSLRTKKSKAQELKTAISAHNVKKEQLEDGIVDATTELKEVSESSLYNVSKMEDVSRRLDIVNKFLTLAKRDFRGILLQNAINYIQERAFHYSQLMFDTKELRFTLDGNNINIAYLNKEYESLSGGEKQKVDIIVQFSIRDMLCTFLNFSSNILVLDEVFDAVDATGCNRIVDIITSQLTDISSVYIITHHSDIPVPYDCRWIVEKNQEGVSSVMQV